jgi:tetratricopeptide (TPR) repeat protein
VRSAPEDPRIINEVAWSLAVSNEKKLRRPRYATKIMDAMMKNNERARESPAYLDTWAVAHAAIGNFEKAVEIQEEALAKAISNNQDAVIEILKAHLDAFRSGEVVIEELP